MNCVRKLDFGAKIGSDVVGLTPKFLRVLLKFVCSRHEERFLCLLSDCCREIALLIGVHLCGRRYVEIAGFLLFGANLVLN